MKTSLGFKESELYGSSMPAPEGKTGEKKPDPIVYPEFSVRGEIAKKLAAALSTGQSVEATVTLSVCGVSDRKEGRYGDGGARVEFEIRDIDLPSIPEGDGDEEDEETAEDAVDSYRATRAEEEAD